MLQFGKHVQKDPKGRDVLGLPLSKAEGRSLDLRESGYHGWIDQNGERATDAEVKEWTARMAARHTAHDQPGDDR